MRIAVVNEISSCAKNPDVVAALAETGNEIINAGMRTPEDRPALTYLHTGLLSALLLHLDLADLVVGGCGTGQGYLNAALQYPGVCCALVAEPLDAWLARRINAPNCVSLALNKGYGWAGDVNLRLIAQALTAPAEELGYPAERAESQSRSRDLLAEISRGTHRAMTEILEGLPASITEPVFACRVLRERVGLTPESELKSYVAARLGPEAAL